MDFRWLAVGFSLLVLVAGCGADDGGSGRETDPAPALSGVAGCRGCHPVELDQAHDFACGRCHGGDETAVGKESAHAGLDPQPARPARMAEVCGGCHPVAHTIGGSRHFTLAGEVNTVRRAFGATEDLASAAEIPTAGPSGEPLSLADDLLRRRCLRCHVGYRGDDYGATRRGTGCAACHLAYEEGKLLSHRFIGRPADRQCQSCHYGNFVGADYYGRFERDFGWEYRVPHGENGQPARPFGLEFHQLSPDIHQQAGMACVDCHPAGELKAARQVGRRGEEKCRQCHDPAWAGPDLLPGLRREDGSALFVLADGGRIKIPQLRHSAHRQYGLAVACAVCHAAFAFHDEGTQLLRLDVQDYRPWAELTTQGSREVEAQLDDALAGGGAWNMPVMSDKLTGEPKLGLWIQGYVQRRWEPAFCRDKEGVLRVCRPLVDLSLSHVNRDGEVALDSARAAAEYRLLPYQPHTIGRAGAFWRDRLRKARAGEAR